MRRHVLLKLSPSEALLGLMLALSLGLCVLAVCPSMCSCSRSHREVDCSCKGLRQLPDGLQHNVRTLNLSHNRFHNLDGQLTQYTHVRILDLSHNRLNHLPTGLPRSLWQLSAASNRIQMLDKNDTVYQWNLRMLDLSKNKLERAIFINNTLTNLNTLNLSHNNFWTLPTNMPIHLEAIDLSHNVLVKVLPGSLDRLSRLTRLFLHANRFSMLPFGVLDKMPSLRLITLGDNPWACHHYANMSYLLSWTQSTPARVLGCPCHTQPVCGGVRPSRTGGWHFGSYNLPPLAAGAQVPGPIPPETGVTGWWYLTVSALLSTPHAPEETLSASRSTGMHLTVSDLSPTASPAEVDHMFQTAPHISPSDSLNTTATSSFSDKNVITKPLIWVYMMPATDHFLTTQTPPIQTKKTTTLRTRSVRRQNQSYPSGISNSSPALVTCSLLPLLNNLGLLSVILLQVL
ncbi:oligodendrocyte-myelin glycoprotein-like isoform X2 [Channa argus]|uniref:oligodendrocyte-myelin glycoprotein-like isoform X2 n=1 Tax=Channa argus TaxID=215402 RepID=UPI00352301B5